MIITINYNDGSNEDAKLTIKEKVDTDNNGKDDNQSGNDKTDAGDSDNKDTGAMNTRDSNPISLWIILVVMIYMKRNKNFVS